MGRRACGVGCWTVGDGKKVHSYFLRKELQIIGGEQGEYIFYFHPYNNNSSQLTGWAIVTTR